MRRSPLVLACSVALSLGLSACANGSTSSKGASATPTTTSPVATSAAPTSGAAPATSPAA
ncbi:MAG: hypothetical protein QOI76_4276, partial [Frankiales bacterium]|nr:hypothetical protein [Frankiales bacterium]